MQINNTKSDSIPSKTLGYVEPQLPKASFVIWIVSACFACLLIWAYIFELEEVSNGTGKVVPTSKEQTISSLEGGILSELHVREGDVVKSGQILVELDPTRLQSNVGESETKLVSYQARRDRLQAEVANARLDFSAEVQNQPEILREETALFESRRSNLNEMVSGLNEALNLVASELRMTEPLVAKGAASEVEVLRLRREANDLKNQINEVRNKYYVEAREELAQVNAEIESLTQVVAGKTDSLNRTIVKAPMDGVVKEIEVTTKGGVVPQNGKIMTIVPMGEKLLVEARISPKDIAFIQMGQEALVKITAYDYSIYGGLKGKVQTISPDTLRDEVKQDQFYYRVYILTDNDHLKNKYGNTFSISSGMIATVDIKTGQKTVLDYLIKPFNKAKEALRER